MESNVPVFVKRAVERMGYNRDSFVEKDMPTVISNVHVLPFFGDMRSTALMASLVATRLKEDLKGKYLVVCSWPGARKLFPYVNEFWSHKDNGIINSLAIGANNFYNSSDAQVEVRRALYDHFENVFSYDGIKKYYDNGFTTYYWREGKTVKRCLPGVPSVTTLTADFKNEMTRKAGDKVLVYPTIRMRSWQRGKVEYLPMPQDVWVHICERLLAESITPVVYQNSQTHDLSKVFADKCVYVVPKDWTHVMSAMRACGMVLDVHSGISRLALLARCPFVAVDERMRFSAHKEYEFDDLAGECVYRKYIFSASTIFLGGSKADWNNTIVDGVINELKGLRKTSSVVPIPDATESYGDVSYDKVRELKHKRLGIRFIHKR
jgi:hypothetical protein